MPQIRVIQKTVSPTPNGAQADTDLKGSSCPADENSCSPRWRDRGRSHFRNCHVSTVGEWP